MLADVPSPHSDEGLSSSTATGGTDLGSASSAIGAPTFSWPHPSLQHVNVAAVLLKAMARSVRKNPEVFSLLFVAFLCLVVAKYTQNSGASQSPAAPPPIFPKDSPVFEFSNGDMQSALSRIQREENEFSFVMYYAHWDGNSRDIAVEFDRAARQLSHRVTFVAVNCWWLHGSCRSRVKTTMYPALLATAPTIRNGLQYTGILQAEEMVSFLYRLCRPFTYVPDIESVYSLHAHHGTVVVGYFDWTTFPILPGLVSFQKAAWLALEKDSIEPIAFAVVTNIRLAQRLGLQQSKSIAMIRTLNSTLLYPRDAKFQAKLIMEWAYKHQESVVQWLAPAGVKSTIMATQLDSSPVVVLFTRHHRRQGLLNDFYMFKKVALDYYNCNNSRLIQRLISAINSARKPTPDNCNEADDRSDSAPSVCECCQTLADPPLTTTMSHGRNVCQVCEHSTTLHPSPCSPALPHSQATWTKLIVHGKSSLAPNSCLHLNYYYSPYSQYQLCCKQCDIAPGHLYSQSERCAVPDSNSGRSAINSVCQGVLSRTDCNSKCQESSRGTKTSNANSNQNSHCRRTLESKENVFHPYLGPFTGLGCRTNRTVNFFAMRSEYFWQFAEQLGASARSGFQAPGKRTAIVLLDIEAEQQHLLAGEITASAIKNFIFNYTTSNLTRHLRSANAPSACSQMTGVCVQEVVSSTFEELVLDSTKDVLLLYYAPWCGFCSRTHHLYLMLAKVFQHSTNLLISRIDGDANDLPWQFTPSSYPTLLLFPAGQKDQSLQFPQSTVLNLPNMIKFVLQHATLL
ncbi:thioredoxin domain-containing protein 11-like [Acanthaster planci]|uniref:Thioredoxin domain-containing protein 11-like n=1 Tax=Acanthaster planci TaxID=133434 RepID=A0A8B7YMA5_ACAPL|nr:thioredoxin domain-containing protein 11-like [Acanthaster planci]